MGGQEMREGVGVRGRGERRDWMGVRKYCIKRGVTLKEGVGLGKNISRGGGAGQRGDKQISSSGAVTLMKLW